MQTVFQCSCSERPYQPCHFESVIKLKYIYGIDNIYIYFLILKKCFVDVIFSDESGFFFLFFLIIGALFGGNIWPILNMAVFQVFN